MTVIDDQSKRHVSVPYAAITSEAAPGANAGEATQAGKLTPPPEIGQREDFQVGQRVSFTDRDLQRRVGVIVRINQQTATIASDGQSWRVSFALLRHIVET